MSRWARRGQLQKITTLRRVRNCGALLDPERGVTLALTHRADGTRGAGYSGLASCGSVWACPQCAHKIATRRADELATAMRAVEERGGTALLLTLTMRHARGDRLGLDRTERGRHYVLERRRKWRNRLDKIDERRDERAVAEGKGWDVDEHAADADDVLEAGIRRDIAKLDPAFAAVGAAARDQRDSDTVELAALEAAQGCWDILTDAWGAVTSGGAWQADQELFGGMLGWARVVEVTDGDNGWHVHIHALLCFAEQVSAALVAGSVGARMFARWQRALERRGFDATDDHGWDLRRVQLGDGDLADYFTKIAHEVTGSQRKEGKRPGGRTPMQLLADAVETYEETAMARWWEWEAVSEGRRQLTWSTGSRDLRKLADLGREATDQEIADEDTPADEYMPLSVGTWDQIVAAGQAVVLLNIAEDDGMEAACAWLSQCGSSLANKRSRAEYLE